MRNEKARNDKEKKKNSSKDCEYCIGSSEQARNFEVMTNYIMSHAQESFDSGHDVAESLRALHPSGTGTRRPHIEVSGAEGESAHNRESRELKIDHKGESAD